MKNLQNQILIAMPSLEDGYFERTVTYICEHNENGAMGIVINQPLEMKVTDLLAQIKVPLKDKLILPEIPVYAGGPVSPERGFVLHRPQQKWQSSMQLTPDIMVTTSRDLLESIGTKDEPEDYLICLGYAGWEKGQLEQELLDNAWLTIPADADLIYTTPIHLRWQQASEVLGIATWQISNQIGHA
ncbi:YqgE/AlgH family protein [Catenovulum agarivorans]|uniref:YqgE/AlgH family protein n=1 Tax=Catenovulum agarivorans TaxID=1172192 RepID=UPI0003814A41|nr:YqgE/AlgH family protein [Catenovulum agarivorans]